MPLPSFNKILEMEKQNFEASKERFEDIISWAERVKHVLHIKKIDKRIFEYFLLIQILKNSFVNSILLSMKGFIFHSFAICRLGVEAFMNLSIIECNIKVNLKIWKDFNYTKRDSKNWKFVKEKYEDVFRRKRNTHDYSPFLTSLEKKEVKKHWETLSNMGSHVNYLQSMFSINFDTTNDVLLKYGLFDVHMKNEKLIGMHLMWIINTYILILRPLNNIFENHELELNYTSNKLDLMLLEWNEFKIKKANDFNINVEKLNTTLS